MLLSGDTIDVLTFEGEPIRDDTFLLLVNAHYEPLTFVLPGQERVEWEMIIDTATDHGFLKRPKKMASGEDCEVSGRSTHLLRLVMGSQAQARHESWKKRQVKIAENHKPEEGVTPEAEAVVAEVKSA
jgi:hypothetical protein